MAIIIIIVTCMYIIIVCPHCTLNPDSMRIENQAWIEPSRIESGLAQSTYRGGFNANHLCIKINTTGKIQCNAEYIKKLIVARAKNLIV